MTRFIAICSLLVLVGCGATLNTDNLYDFDKDGSVDGEDCEPEDPFIYPGATEICDDGVDNDCDGDTDYADADCIVPGDDDDDDTQGTGPDNDGDGWPESEDCDDNDPELNGYDLDSDGYSTCDGDCDDMAGSVCPGATDIYGDGVDQNCDGVDGTDMDGDGYASEGSGGEDCDDTDSDVYPGAPEQWYDGVDSDCAGDNDYDQDGDGVEVEDDCDDTDSDVYPDADDGWDGWNQNCDGISDWERVDVEIYAAYGETDVGVVNGDPNGHQFTVDLGQYGEYDWILGPTGALVPDLDLHGVGYATFRITGQSTGECITWGYDVSIYPTCHLTTSVTTTYE